MTDKKTEALKLALKKAFDLGQRYWQQADSDFTSQWRKADVTLASFNQLVEDTIREALAEQPAQQEPVAYAVYHRMGGSKTFHWPEQHSEDGDHNEYQLVPLYTSPPIEATPLASQSRSDVKPWVGLTKEERVDFTLSCGSYETVCSIEAKLKAKNSQ